MRSHREAAGLSRAKLAEALGCSPGWIEKLEICEKPPSEATSDDLDTYFKTSARTFHTIWSEIKKEGKYPAGPPGYPGYVRREAQATVLQIFTALALHGLFQTPEYAREILREGRSKDETEKLLAARLERQKILHQTHLAQVSMIVDEGVLHRPTGGASTMKEQVLHLSMLAQDPKITLQIVPSSKGAYRGTAGSFTILSSERERDVVYVEGQTSGQLLEDSREVHEHALVFNLIRGAALSADQSLDLLQTIVEGL